MEIALSSTGALLTIEQIRNMAVVPDLSCPGETSDGSECGGKAWPTALHSTKKAATFAAHHRPDCEGASTPSKSRPGDAGHTARQGNLPVRWHMRLGLTTSSSGPDGRRVPNPKRPGSATRRHTTDPSLKDLDTSEQRAFSTLLLNLLANTLPPGLELVIGTRAAVPAKQIIVHARDATINTYNNREIIIWGKVSGYRSTPWDGVILQLEEAADSAAILVDRRDLSRLKITDLRSLVGRDVIAYGRYSVAATSNLPNVRALHTAIAFYPRVARQRS